MVSNTDFVKMKTDNGIAIISQEEAEKRLMEEAKKFAIAELITKHKQELKGIIEKRTRELYEYRIIPWAWDRQTEEEWIDENAGIGEEL